VRSTPSWTASTPGFRHADADMRAPAFWYRPPGMISTAPSHRSARSTPLAPHAASAAAPRVKVGVPVICVGNINAGGTGKTPTTIALAERLRDRGVSVHVVTRGHGGALEGPVEVEELRHRASDTGDEALSPRGLRENMGGEGQAGGRAGPPWRPGPRSSCWTTGSRTLRLPMICRSSWWTPIAGSAMAVCFPPDRSGTRHVGLSARRLRAVGRTGRGAAAVRRRRTGAISVPLLSGTLEPLPPACRLRGPPGPGLCRDRPPGEVLRHPAGDGGRPARRTRAVGPSAAERYAHDAHAAGGRGNRRAGCDHRKGRSAPVADIQAARSDRARQAAGSTTGHRSTRPSTRLL
jgi:hypothetical protein